MTERDCVRAAPNPSLRITWMIAHRYPTFEPATVSHCTVESDFRIVFGNHFDPERSSAESLN